MNDPGEPPRHDLAARRSALPPSPRYGRWVAVLGVIIVVLVAINGAVTKPNGAGGIAPGQPLAPFALPLVTGSLKGDADIATHRDQGQAGKVPACSERGARILNICQLYEQGPVVLALFVDGAGCANVLSEMQTLTRRFPDVRFAAVSIKGNRAQLRGLVRTRHLSFPVGIDEDGALAILYKLASCPQVNFAGRGGVVQSKALLSTPSPALLRERVSRIARAAG